MWGRGKATIPIEAYLREGAAVRGRIERLLPTDWSWGGKRVLDFGCGSARVLRQFLREAEQAEFWGCDIDAPSIAWVEANLSPRCGSSTARHRRCRSTTGAFDLVYATCVFAHIGDRWSDGWWSCTGFSRPGSGSSRAFSARGYGKAMIGEPYAEEAVGMTVRRHWTAQDATVFHSSGGSASTGRAFDVDAVARAAADRRRHAGR